ncbi:TPA: DUF6694 family lipoprotein [Enterobacter roggenkampii]
MRVIYIFSLALTLLLAGCDNAPKFDGANQESLRYSGEKVIESLSPEQKQELLTAISDTLSYYNTEAMINGDKNYSPDKMRLVILNGKTANQIISEAKDYREKKEKLIQQYKSK